MKAITLLVGSIGVAFLWTTKDSKLTDPEGNEVELLARDSAGDIIGANEVESVFQAAKDTLSEFIMNNPGCTTLTTPCGHWQTPLDGISGALQKSADGCLQFGIKKSAFRNTRANVDSNTIGVRGEDTDTDDTDHIAMAWHESQHPNHASGGALSVCDHGELYFATEKLLIAMTLCGLGFPSKEFQDDISNAVTEFTEKCSH